MYKICEQDDNNNNNNGNGNSNINNNNNNNNNNTISYFVQTVRNGPILLCQHHVNNSFHQIFDGLPTNVVLHQYRMHGQLFSLLLVWMYK